MSGTRRRTDRIYPARLPPRAEEAARLVAERPGITVEEMAAALGVGMKRSWQILGWLERGRVRLHRADPDAPTPRASRDAER